jgi:hypothetical protein
MQGISSIHWRLKRTQRAVERGEAAALLNQLEAHTNEIVRLDRGGSNRRPGRFVSPSLELL